MDRRATEHHVESDAGDSDRERHANSYGHRDHHGNRDWRDGYRNSDCYIDAGRRTNLGDAESAEAERVTDGDGVGGHYDQQQGYRATDCQRYSTEA